MCGVSGILYKKATGSGFGPVGDDLVKMLESMTHRGKDSSGITVAGEDLAGDLVIRIWTGDQRHSWRRTWSAGVQFFLTEVGPWIAAGAKDFVERATISPPA